MKAILYDSYGGPENMHLQELDEPEPGEGEILVRIHASSVNPIDWKLRSGALRMIHPLKLPTIPGFDLAGEVVKCGPEATKFKVGDKIYSRSNKPAGEASAEYIALEESVVAACPDVSFLEAASMPLAALTAIQALQDKANLKTGERVLVNGASGGVGMFGVQVAKAMGAEVIGVCGPTNLGFVQSLGADKVIDYRSADPVANKDEYDVIFDAVGSLAVGRAKRALKKNGRAVTTLPSPGYILGMATNWFSPYSLHMVIVSSNGEQLDYLRKLVNAGKVKTNIHSEYSLQDLARAHEESAAGRVRGKIVIRID